MSDRRSVLKSAGVLLSGGLAASSVNAKEQNGKISLEEAGIGKAVKEHISNGRIDQAYRLLDQHNVRYDSGVDDDIGNTSPDSDEIDADGIWSESDSTLHTAAIHEYNDVWTISSVAFINWGSGANLRDARYINDAMGMSWNHNHWDPKDRTSSNINKTVGGELKDYVEATYTGDYETYGLGIEVDIDTSAPLLIDQDFHISLQTELIRDTDDDRRGVKSHYVQTYSTGLTSMNIQIGAGVWSVSIGSDAGKWEPGLEAMAYP